MNPTKPVFQFYDTEGTLISGVGRAMCIALDQGAAVVCIATDAHRQRLERHLMVRGIDVTEAQRRTSSFILMPTQRCRQSQRTAFPMSFGLSKKWAL